MVTLNIMPPYTEADVKQAYLTLAKAAHPDRGGSPQAFHVLQEAYEQALEYVAFRGDRRHWIAAKMDRYVATQNAIETLQAMGAEVGTHSFDWLDNTVGDFAHLTEIVEYVRMADSPRGDELIAALADEHRWLAGLSRLQLPSCQITDASLPSLAQFQKLQHLDLGNNPIGNSVKRLCEQLPLLETIRLSGTQVSAWTKLRIWFVLRFRHGGRIGVRRYRR